MTWLDWVIVAVFFFISILLGTVFTRRAGQSLESYFVSNRSLPWWLAGSSIAATAFSSDTPLLITGMVRQKGIWGTWEVLSLALSTMLSVFVFAKLWKRANVLTEVELVERRYSGPPAAVLRGFKAIYWGVLYNCFIIGAWPVTGLRKVLEELLHVSRETAIVSCVVLAALYTSCSGLWGVMLTDFFQFLWAMAGAVLLAWAAIHALGGIGVLRATLATTPYVHAVPPLPGAGESLIASPFGWFLGLILIQWWAWKNADGGGVIVQRLVSCKDERQAMKSVLWFSIAHYCLRAWPWILTALASLILIPNESVLIQQGGRWIVDHERAYPLLITQLLPAGLRGVMVASFFAAFLSTVSTQLNWGASYVVNDWYKRFINRTAEDRHYVWVSRLVPFGLAAGSMGVAFAMTSVGQAFTLILNLTAGIGPVLLLRWGWWRVNAWSEIAALVASPVILAIRPQALAWLGWPSGSLTELAWMVLGTALVWIPVTLLTPPVDRAVLKRFYADVRPPGAWKPVALVTATQDVWLMSVFQWAVGSLAIVLSALGPLEWLLHNRWTGAAWCGLAAAAWVVLAYTIVQEGR